MNNKRCYLAPERFLENYDDSKKSYNLLSKDMDIFSLGCVIAEILMDIDSLFDLTVLREYGRGNYTELKNDLERKIDDH